MKVNVSQMLENVAKDEAIKKDDKLWYNLRPILGCANWAIFYILIASRQTGKSYAVANFFVDQFVNKGIPFIWMRLTEAQANKLKANGAEHLIDPDLQRKYNLDLITSGNNIYHVTKRSKPDKNGKTKIVEKKLMARVYALSTFYKDKGSIFDKDFLNDPTMRYNICCDEFQPEAGEKRTFPLIYALCNELENLVRNTKDRIKVFFCGNQLQDASDVLCAFDFIPEEFGIYKLKSKRCVIHYVEPTEAYREMRKGSIAEILMPNSSTFTNKVDTDNALISKKPLVSPSYIIKFTKSQDDWYTVWDSNIIAKYKGEKKPIIAMRPYLDEVFSPDIQKNMITLFDTRSFQFRNLITFKQFQNCMEMLKPRK